MVEVHRSMFASSLPSFERGFDSHRPLQKSPPIELLHDAQFNVPVCLWLARFCASPTTRRRTPLNVGEFWVGQYSNGMLFPQPLL